MKDIGPSLVVRNRAEVILAVNSKEIVNDKTINVLKLPPSSILYPAIYCIAESTGGIDLTNIKFVKRKDYKNIRFFNVQYRIDTYINQDVGFGFADIEVAKAILTKKHQTILQNSKILNPYSYIAAIKRTLSKELLHILIPLKQFGINKIEEPTEFEEIIELID